MQAAPITSPLQSSVLSASRNQSISWADLKGFDAVVAPLSPTIDQCSVQREGRELALLLLFKEPNAGMVDIKFRREPDDPTLVVIGRVIRAHQRATNERSEFL